MTNDISQSIVSSMHPTVSSLKTSDYQVVSTDYVIGVGVLTNSITITLPTSPVVGDQYTIKDVVGSLNDGYTITIDGYSNNIDGELTFTLAQSRASITVLFTGTEWSIQSFYAGVSNGNGYGNYSDLPTQGQKGRTYYAIDTGTFFYDDGIAWRPFGHDGALTPIDPGSFSWQNQAGATATSFGTSVFISLPNASGLRFMYQNVPSTPYTLTAKLIHLGNFTPNESMIYGLAWGDGTKLMTVHVNDNSDAMNLNVALWNSTTSLSSEVFTYNFRDVVDRMEWFRLSDDGTNRQISVSRDGINFISIYTNSSTTFLTGTRVGILASTSLSGDAYVSCESFQIT